MRNFVAWNLEILVYHPGQQTVHFAHLFQGISQHLGCLDFCHYKSRIRWPIQMSAFVVLRPIRQ